MVVLLPFVYKAPTYQRLLTHNRYKNVGTIGTYQGLITHHRYKVPTYVPTYINTKM